MALFRVDYSGRGELADRQQKLAQLLSRLQKISEGQISLTLQVNLHVYYNNVITRYICLFLLWNMIVVEYNVAVFITNQMTADPGATMS